MPRTFRPQDTDPGTPQSSEAELITQPVAVYYRQSTIAQVGNVSTAMQTIDLVDELMRRGWKREDILLIDDDEGVSGTKRIDEREGMSHLFELIAERKIGAVACQDEDRLFRDMTQIQVNIFIDTCRKARVKVITPYFIYDFAHPLHGEFHARQFRFKCDMAAEYLKIYITGRLTPARQRIMKEGRWSGSKIPVGFMVDMRKHLPGGAENPNYRKYVPFEPYAQIVREYFRIFLENGGAIRKTIRQIRQQRISFPACKPPEGFRMRYQLKYGEDGCYIASTCFRLLMTNPAYIGHWHFKGVVIRWNNHEPLIEPDVFMRAFNYLSKYTLTGEANPDYHYADKYGRPQLDERRGVERPLLVGLIYSKVNDRWYRAGVQFEKRHGCYLYVLSRVEADGTHCEWARRGEWIDQAVIARLKQKLQATFDVDTWTQAIRDNEQALERHRKIKKLQLSSLEEEKQNLVGSLGKLTDEMFIQEAEQRYKQVVRERERLLSELASLEQKRHQTLTTEQAYALFKRIVTGWDTMTQDARRHAIALFIERINVSDYNRAGHMRLAICWRDGSTDEIHYWHKSHAAHWTIENTERLLALFDAGASQLELAAAFPDLKWHQIFNEIKKHRGLVRFSPSHLGKNETYHAYVASGGRKGKHTSSRWQPDEDEQLCQMVKNGTTQVEIMKVFPFRRWIQIQHRIKTLLGKGTRVKSSRIRQHLSYDEYVQQTKTPNEDASSGTPCRGF